MSEYIFNACHRNKTINNKKQVINPPMYEKNIKNTLLFIIPTSFLSSLINLLIKPDSLNSLNDLTSFKFLAALGLITVFLLFTFLLTFC